MPRATFFYGGLDAGPMRLTSPTLAEGKPFPSQYTCDGADVSPPLEFLDVPAGTKSLALVMDDPDAPMGTWDHWLLWNLPATTTRIPENVPKDKVVKGLGNACQGTNTWPRIGYGGPCPPSGTHTYVFKAYALDAMLDLAPGARKPEVERAVKGHVKAQATMKVPYSRKR